MISGMNHENALLANAKRNVKAKVEGKKSKAIANGRMAPTGFKCEVLIMGATRSADTLPLRGEAILRDPVRNKDAAFTLEERRRKRL